MACEYFVGGKWVTESQFKEILNNGLLDNLVANGDISLKGYKPDSSKVIKRETKTITNDKVPANKLANILANEIKTRAGYPMNMLAALELNSDGTDFKIPLWASPYARKFESLLTSLVSNKVVKQKLPGTSSVLGSEEGFKIKEGDEAAGDLDKSGIVFTESFDPVKGLQPMRLDPVTKKILPDQVIMPWKFRMESGEILNLDEFTVRTEDGKLMLDMTKVPKDILNTFGFRIPTQKQNSMAGIEIVGFLPEAMGDLLLAPRDFTRRMGSDFDVDKLYQYFYNVFHQDGKLYNNFLSDPEAIEKAKEATIKQIEEIKDSLKFTKEERKLVDNYIKQNLERTENNEEPEVAQKASDLIRQSISQADRLALDNAFERLSILNRSYVAARQNNIVKTHLRIANSSNPEVIKMFLGTDSPGQFKELSTQVEKIRKERGLIAPIVTILSDTYQRTKYINATAGKDAVGNFSLDSTFNTVVQGKDLILIDLTPGTEADVYGTLENPRTPTKEDFLTYNMPLAIFGNIESKGDISNKYTLRSQAIINKAKQEKRDLTDEEKKSLKYKSEVIKTVQSSALDNEKEQILDKLNINNQTFDAIRALSLLGFEEKDIAGLISQEIIWEYVEALKDTNSSLTPYNPNAEEEITNMLIAKYDPQGKFIGLSREMLTKYQSQSGEQLMDNIANQTLKPIESGETPDYNLQQLAILEKFKSLSAHGKTIKQLQSTINTASKGLPKSLIEVNAKVEQVSKLPLIQVFNAEKLLGQYANTQLIKPEGINGYATYYGTLFADRIFNDYFPYKTQGFQTAVAEILTHTPKGTDVSINKKAETQAEVFEDVKSYLYGNPDTNLFSGDPTLERKRLFIDSKDNKSLATVLNTLSSQPWFQKNGFLNKLSFDLNKNGQISRINFEAAAGENFDERAIYDGFVYLLTKNFPVGAFNGRDYTSRTLAQELIAAAFLEGGNQGAKQYLKYVPISYLKVLGFGDYLQKVPFDFMATFYGNLSDYGPIYNQPSSFTRQYFQNNPDKTKTVTLSNLKGNENKTPKEYFTLNEEALINNFVDVIDPATGDSTQMQTQFLSIYDTKEPSKYALFEFDSIDRNYKRIPVLAGSYGFVGYNSTPNVSIPVERSTINTTPKINATAPGYNITNIPVVPTKSFDVNVVNNTAEPELTAGMPISKTLSGTKEALDDILNNLETAEGVSTLNKQLMVLFRELQLPERFKVEYVNYGKGMYDYKNDTIYINLNHKQHTTADDLATTVLHELTHVFTGEAIKKYERGDIDLSPSQISAIQNLEKLQRLYINNLTEIGEEGSLAEFKAKYEAYAASDRTKSPSISREDISKYYGAIKLSEFVSMALTDVEFQKRLNNIKTEDGKTIWEQIKDALLNLLNTLGLDIKPGSALATSVKDTFDLIEANQDALKANNITTETFMEHGTKYKFQVNGNGEVIKAEYSQGMSTVYNPMNAKNAQKKYDSLKAGIIEQPIVKPTKSMFEIVGTEVVFAEDGSTAQEYNTLEEAQEGLKQWQATEKEETTENKFDYKGKSIKTAFPLTTGQEQALESLVDFVRQDDEKTITLQGAAGTGKTAVIGYLQKYFGGTGINFVYLAPTHAATAELAFATVKSGNKELPMTVQSAVSDRIDNKTQTRKISFTKKLENKLGYVGNIIVVDEVSMLSAKDYLALNKAIENKDVKIVFMGDILQIPEVNVANPEVKQVSLAFSQPRQLNLTEVKRTESDAILEVLGTLRKNTQPQIPVIPNTEEIKYLSGTEYNKELVDTLKKEPEDTLVISYTNAGVTTTNSKIRGVLGRTGDLQENDIIVGYLGYSSKQIEKGNIANSIRYTVQDVQKVGSTYKIIATSKKLKALKDAGVSVSEIATGNYLQLNDGDAFKFSDLTQEDFDKNNREVSDVMKRLHNAKKAALQNPRLWPDYYSIEGETAKFFSVNSVGDNYIYNPTTDKMEKYTPLIHKDLRRSFPELYVEKGIDLGHAITIHKSQGSTVKNVFFDADTLPKGTSSKLFKNSDQIGNEKHSLIYVAMSRASNKLVVNNNQMSNFYTLRGAPFNLSALGNIESLREMPIDTESESNQPSLDDLEAYYKSLGEDQTLETSPINPKEVEKYLLICGK
jgi:hypothetical protein